MTTVRQDRDFKSIVQDLIPDGLLQVAIDFIQRNLEPDDVFDEKELKNWAENNGYVKE